jgi:hypothetical protein
MSQPPPWNRREFLKAGAATTAAITLGDGPWDAVNEGRCFGCYSFQKTVIRKRMVPAERNAAHLGVPIDQPQ